VIASLRIKLTKLAPVFIIALAAGCGPFGYLKKVAKDSSKAVADAEAVGAEEHAPYEYWGAVTYLEQSKILMGYSEYERSFDYGDRAKQLAIEAKKKAEMRKHGKMVESLDEKDTPPASKAGATPSSSLQTETSAGKGEAKASVKVGGEP